MTLLTIDRLSAGYGRSRVLHDVSLTLGESEIVCLLGANGAGKSTLLAAISGILPTAGGEIHFAGQSIVGIGPGAIVRRGLAQVPERRQLFGGMSVEENLRIAGDYGRKGHWTLERIYALFPILAEKRHAPALSLSGGQQQMVAIGRALIANPDLILFDEISLGLAPIVVNEVYAAFPAILASGVGAIVVEQDIARVRKIARHLVCIREGRIVLDGAAETLTLHDLTVTYFGE